MFLKRFLPFVVIAMLISSFIVACEEEISQENSKPQLDEGAEEMDEPVRIGTVLLIVNLLRSGSVHQNLVQSER
ncbi:hypothetical protein BKP35_00735 [Anaerobacillus arseniciselenatis]|uniref:Uncharacterized protein n=1 Tax=Anaerobacillus arseniciselenatis TaxID=85682 RepID=A0A1S2LTS9_9BACI|nr:hypothetical protein [Anaerobacillus arseniciselenatis]OIJ15553.1 hypothetical protein BKP35_00735 [Anaerobacillus arseniciselenatis]